MQVVAADQLTLWSWVSVNLLTRAIGQYPAARMADHEREKIADSNASMLDKKWKESSLLGYLWWRLFYYSPIPLPLEPTLSTVLMENEFTGVAYEVRLASSKAQPFVHRVRLGSSEYHVAVQADQTLGFHGILAANRAYGVVNNVQKDNVVVNPCLPPEQGYWMSLQGRQVYQKGVNTSLGKATCRRSFSQAFVGFRKPSCVEYGNNDFVLTGLSNYIADHVLPFNQHVYKANIDTECDNVCAAFDRTRSKNLRFLYQDMNHCLQMNFLYSILHEFGINSVAIVNTINDVFPHWSVGCAVQGIADLFYRQ